MILSRAWFVVQEDWLTCLKWWKSLTQTKSTHPCDLILHILIQILRSNYSPRLFILFEMDVSVFTSFPFEEKNTQFPRYAYGIVFGWIHHLTRFVWAGKPIERFVGAEILMWVIEGANWWWYVVNKLKSVCVYFHSPPLSISPSTRLN